MEINSKPKPVLVKYVRDENRNPFACIVATDKDKIGVSICHPNDTFSKRFAREIAMRRAELHRKESYEYIYSEHPRVTDILESLSFMYQKAQQVFK